MTTKGKRKPEAAGRGRRGGWGCLVRLAIASLLLVLLAAAGLALAYKHFIVDYSGEEISREHFRRLLSTETPVYYADGESLVGVFFHEEHRRYVPFAEIPRAFIDALIAAEDRNFYRHPGFDLRAIARAAIKNIQAGRIVQGGSTLSQQTAENLFPRRERSFWAQLVELVNALRLEAHYSKDEILELYANQFFVCGNGRGIAIAARYFFDKEVDELDLVECAFIAGAVKGPNRYNPMIKRDEEDRARAVRKALDRKNYVLRNMRRSGMIAEEAFQEAVAAEVPFRPGRFRHSMSVLLDYVDEELSSDPMLEILAEAGIENIATSGIRIYTTLDKGLQEAAEKALRNRLSALETQVSGYSREAVQARYASRPETGAQSAGEYSLGEVTAVEGDRKNPAVLVEVDRVTHRIGREGLEAMAAPLAQHRRGKWAEAGRADLRVLLDEIRPGDRICVRDHGPDGEGDRPELSLAQWPEVEGGLVVLDGGAVRAMAGGFENIHFNRGAHARRQLGSVFKPLVYAAAFQLGWSPLDRLCNERRVFPYQGIPYFPRPDHASPHGVVSLAWAGVKSENLASVWLLYHLCDRLTLSQFRHLAGLVDLAPHEGEDHNAFRRRIRDRMGVVVDRKRLAWAAYESARSEVEVSLLFEDEKSARIIRDLDYGLDYGRYLRTNSEELSSEEDPETIAELRRHEEILKRNFRRLSRVRRLLMERYEALSELLAVSGEEGALPEGFFVLEWSGGEEVLFIQDDDIDDDDPPEGAVALTWWTLRRLQLERGTGPQEVPFMAGQVLVSGLVRAAALERLDAATAAALERLEAYPRYSMEILHHVRDFKVLVGLTYLVRLAGELGVETELDAVLSLPLGSSAVTLIDLASLYAALTSGRIAADPASARAAVIDRIEDLDGAVIYRRRPKEAERLDGVRPDMVSDILRNVVRHGTGRAADEAVLLSSEDPERDRLLERLGVKVPVFGKTGTANDYTSAAFVGGVPYLDEGGSQLSPGRSCVLAVYVGYDDNRTMSTSSIRVHGAFGALPVWTDVAKAVVRYKGIGGRIDLADLAFEAVSELPVRQARELIVVPVDSGSGLPLPPGAGQAEWEEASAVVMAAATSGPDGYEPVRSFRPSLGQAAQGEGSR